MHRWIGMLVCAMALACGEDNPPPADQDDGDTDQQGDGDNGDADLGAITLSLDQAALTLPELGSADVHLTATLTGPLTGSAVTYAFSAMPTGVSASLTGDTLSLSAALLATNLTTPIELTATAGDKSATATLTLTVAPPIPFTVSGKIVGFQQGRPIRAMTSDQVVVSLWRRGATSPATVVFTNNDSFTFPDVVPPYDLLIDVEAGPGVAARTRQLIVGVARPDPVVVYVGKVPDPTLSAGYVGTTITPNPSLQNFGFDIDCDSGHWGFTTYNTNFTQDLAILLSGPAAPEATTCTGRLFAYHLFGGVLSPTTYSVQASMFPATADLAHNVSTILPLEAGPLGLPPHAVELEVTFAEEDHVGHGELLWLPGPGLAYTVNTGTSTSGSSFNAPASATLTIALCISPVAPGASVLDLPLSGTTQCRRLNAASSTVAYGEVFEGTSPGTPSAGRFPGSGGFHGYVVNDAAGAGSTVVFTSGIVDTVLLASRGLALEMASSYAWQTISFDGIADADTFASRVATRGGVAARNAGFTVSVLEQFESN